MSERSEKLFTAIRVLGIAHQGEADAWVRGSGLTRQQAFTLGYIEQNQDRGVIARELAESFAITPASVASLLQGLEDRGLVRRTVSAQDSRIKLLTVTAEGSQLVVGFDEEMREAQERLFSPLDPQEQEQLLGLLTRLTENITLPERWQRPLDG